MGKLRRADRVIVVLEPTRPPGFVSGGYRYQEEIGRRLAAAGAGELRAIDGSELAAVVARLHEERHSVVVDGLFAEHTPLPPGVLALLHCVPSRPIWCEQPLPVMTTAATTAAAPWVRARATATEVVRPGLDAVFRPSDATREPGPLRVVMVGTVCPAKRQREVAALLRPHADRCELTLLGDLATHADEVAAVRAAAGPLPLALRGALPSAAVAAELRRSDLFVHASRSESFGMAVAEACACGVPVLAYTTGEIATFVANGENGWLVDDAAAFATRVRAAIGRPDLLAQTRRRRRRSTLADWDATAQAFAAACQRLLHSTRP